MAQNQTPQLAPSLADLHRKLMAGARTPRPAAPRVGTDWTFKRFSLFDYSHYTTRSISSSAELADYAKFK